MIGEWSESDADVFGGRLVRAELLVMTVGPEGIRWLNENAPGWREWVDVTQVQAQRVVCAAELRTTRPLLWARDQLAHDLAKELTRGVESIEVVGGSHTD